MNVSKYDETALQVNAPVYAFYAKRIVERTGITAGNCLDLGCGGGYLGLALAAITDLRFTFLDASDAMLERAEQNISRFAIANRATTVLARVQEIPLPNESFELIISRGSIPFWDELPKAFAEIYRLLKPGGKTYIGGGMGPPELREELRQKMQKRYPEYEGQRKRIPRRADGEYEQALATAGITTYTIHRNDEGTWIMISK